MRFFEGSRRVAEPLYQRFRRMGNFCGRLRFAALLGEHLLDVGHDLLEQFTVARLDAARRRQLAFEFCQFSAQVL